MTDFVPVITIDGPAGAGKSTVSCMLAKRLAYKVLVSGALYRSVALHSLQQRISPDRVDLLLKIVAQLEIKFVIVGDQIRTLLAEKDITDNLQDELCAERASMLGQIPEVRQALLGIQRNFCVGPGLIADGRDMGTIVFPNAACKIFLTAGLEERAKRRKMQLQGTAISDKLSDLCQHLAERDQRDKSRHIAPLKPAEDAVIIDTTAVSPVSVVDQIMVQFYEK